MNSAVIIVLLLWKQAVVEGLRIVELRVPAHAAEGGSALLGCQFDLEGDDLYSVKWYKDDQEFYRYVPLSSAQGSYFPMPGVFVDVSRSSSSVVTLENLTRDSGGFYRCEVSGEAPYFNTIAEVKFIDIQLLPNNMPLMTGIKNEMNIGDLIDVNCTSTRSRPKAQIKWLINDLPATNNELNGPWDKSAKERSDAKDTTLGLSFVLRPNHFRKGVMTLKCQVSLAPLYQQEVVHHILQVVEPSHTENTYSAMDNYEESLVQGSFDSSSTAESRDLLVQVNKSSSKISSWAIIPSLFILLLLI